MSYFFDGTGNNLEADLPSLKHSNVARLYLARVRNEDDGNRKNFYIPGLGTRFKEIGDPGGSAGLAFGAWGDKRLDWAREQLDEMIQKALARAANPVNKIRMVHIALFGFSRGAALARAFAAKLAEDCEYSGGRWVLLHHGERVPIRIYFMGLFDTVASVGVPQSARKNSWVPLALLSFSGPTALVGALLTLVASKSDGHYAWAGDLRIPGMVERCVHMVSCHEMRNSFPLDTVLQKDILPANCEVYAYPGVHSDVGGGYRPGEQGRSAKPTGQLSLLPLRSMYLMAREAGVPLLPYDSMESDVQADFDVDPALVDAFKHYMQTVGWQARPLRNWIANHMGQYFRYRILKIAQRQAARAGQQPDPDALRIRSFEAKIAEEKKQHQAALAQLKRAMDAELRFKPGPRGNGRFVKTPDHAVREEAYHRERMRYQTLPSVGSFLEGVAEIDQEFLEDSQGLRNAAYAELSFYQQVIRDAWDDPKPLDPEIVAFFDKYVHDSLSDFRRARLIGEGTTKTDNTRLVEPRVLYQGGDERIALSQSKSATTTTAAA